MRFKCGKGNDHGYIVFYCKSVRLYYTRNNKEMNAMTNHPFRRTILSDFQFDIGTD